MSAAAYISKLTGDLVVEETVTERRLADPGWVRRHKRSLGRNKQFRACLAVQHEVRKEMEKLNKAREQKNASSASEIVRRLNEFLGRVPRMFTRRTATS